MKKLFVLLAVFVSVSCTPEIVPIPAKYNSQRCGVVGHKYTSLYQNGVMHYFVQFSVDTVMTCPPGITWCGHVEDIEVPFAVFDTILTRRYPDHYCY